MMGKISLCIATTILLAGAVAAELQSAAPPAKFKVESLPGYANPDGTPKKLPSSWYTGYIDAGVPPVVREPCTFIIL